jgi:hypothetical protein
MEREACFSKTPIPGQELRSDVHAHFFVSIYLTESRSPGCGRTVGPRYRDNFRCKRMQHTWRILLIQAECRPGAEGSFGSQPCSNCCAPTWLTASGTTTSLEKVERLNLFGVAEPLSAQAFYGPFHSPLVSLS